MNQKRYKNCIPILFYILLGGISLNTSAESPSESMDSACSCQLDPSPLACWRSPVYEVTLSGFENFKAFESSAKTNDLRIIDRPRRTNRRHTDETTPAEVKVLVQGNPDILLGSVTGYGVISISEITESGHIPLALYAPEKFRNTRLPIYYPSFRELADNVLSEESSDQGNYIRSSLYLLVSLLNEGVYIFKDEDSGESYSMWVRTHRQPYAYNRTPNHAIEIHVYPGERFAPVIERRYRETSVAGFTNDSDITGISNNTGITFNETSIGLIYSSMHEFGYLGGGMNLIYSEEGLLIGLEIEGKKLVFKHARLFR